MWGPELAGFDRRDGMTAALGVETRSFHHLKCKLLRPKVRVTRLL